MAKTNGSGVDTPTLSVLITPPEMMAAFELAEALGIKNQFGSSSPLGGMVIITEALLMCIIDLETRIKLLEAGKDSGG